MSFNGKFRAFLRTSHILKSCCLLVSFRKHHSRGFKTLLIFKHHSFRSRGFDSTFRDWGLPSAKGRLHSHLSSIRALWPGNLWSSRGKQTSGWSLLLLRDCKHIALPHDLFLSLPFTALSQVGFKTAWWLLFFLPMGKISYLLKCFLRISLSNFLWPINRNIVMRLNASFFKCNGHCTLAFIFRPKLGFIEGKLLTGNLENK